MNAKIRCAYLMRYDVMQFPLQVVLWNKCLTLYRALFTSRWLRQSLTVHLAVVVAGYLLNLHNHLRNHICWLLCGYMTLDGLTVKFVVTGNVCHDIGAVKRVFTRLNRCLFHTRTRKDS